MRHQLCLSFQIPTSSSTLVGLNSRSQHPSQASLHRMQQQQQHQQQHPPPEFADSPPPLHFANNAHFSTLPPEEQPEEDAQNLRGRRVASVALVICSKKLLHSCSEDDKIDNKFPPRMNKVGQKNGTQSSLILAKKGRGKKNVCLV